MQKLKNACKNGELLQYTDKEDKHHCLSGRKGNIYCAALPQQCKSLSMLTQNIGDYQFPGPKLAGHCTNCKESLQRTYSNPTQR